jgi:hypothetical protein
MSRVADVVVGRKTFVRAERLALDRMQCLGGDVRTGTYQRGAKPDS